jgi:hypothetical protein
MAVLATAYPRYYQGKTDAEVDAAISLWHEMLAEYPAELVAYAVKNVIKSSPYPPVIADVIKQVEAATQSRLPSDAELWEALYKAISDSSYHAGERFLELPPECKEFAGSPRQLKDMGQIDVDTLQTVTKALFYKQIPILRARRTARETMPENIRGLISGMSEKMQIEGANT